MALKVIQRPAGLPPWLQKRGSLPHFQQTRSLHPKLLGQTTQGLGDSTAAWPSRSKNANPMGSEGRIPAFPKGINGRSIKPKRLFSRFKIFWSMP
jgi:hypothetical protein